jgi:arginyl-tRNA synthetase
VADTLEPHHLCGYLYVVASLFATFYQQCPVLKAATEQERASRLSLCDLTARVLSCGLGLVGIDVPERM